MRYNKITCPDINNGIGFRVTLWVSGCTHHCKGCHNKGTWNFKSGKLYDREAEEKIYGLLSPPYIKGLTLSGGDPMDSAQEVLGVISRIKEKFPEKDIWLYTGYSMLQVMGSREKQVILPYIDYLVDGEYRQDLRDVTLAFRGSKNQVIWHRNGDNIFTVIDMDKHTGIKETL